VTVRELLRRLVGRDVEHQAGELLRIVSVEVLDARTVLICEGADGPTTLVVPAVPSSGRARSLGRVMRVDRVDIEFFGPSVSAVISGVSHRIPTRRSLPVSVALGLVERGFSARVIVRRHDVKEKE